MIEVEEKKDGEKIIKKVKARIFLPKSGKERLDRYKHYMDNEKFKGKTLNSYIKSIESTKNQIEKLTKRTATLPSFAGNAVQLHKSALTFYENNILNLSIYPKREHQISFYGTDVKRIKSRHWYESVLKQIIRNQATYSTLIKKNEDFYIQYPLKIEVEQNSISSSYKAMGIDRGINNLIVSVIINHKRGKPHNVTFYSGEKLWEARLKYRAIIRRLKGQRRKNRKMRVFGGKVKGISRNIIQELSRRVIEEALVNKPVVIVMEDLKDVTEQKGGKKYKKEAKLRFKLTNFVYSQLQKAIEYKALESGVGFDYIPPEYTSQTCSKCGNIDKNNRRSQGNFKCTDDKCGYQTNADLNAAINIANKFYEKFK